MLFPVVSSLQQVIKDVVYFYHKFEHFLLSDSLIDISPQKYTVNQTVPLG